MFGTADANPKAHLQDNIFKKIGVLSLLVKLVLSNCAIRIKRIVVMRGCK